MPDSNFAAPHGYGWWIRMESIKLWPNWNHINFRYTHGVDRISPSLPSLSFSPNISQINNWCAHIRINCHQHRGNGFRANYQKQINRNNIGLFCVLSAIWFHLCGMHRTQSVRHQSETTKFTKSAIGTHQKRQISNGRWWRRWRRRQQCSASKA